MQLVITEKPSVGMAVAKVLGADKRHEGYVEGNGYIVSWCVGHLVELADPERYGEQWAGGWTYGSLPILPDEFQFVVKPETSKQYKVVKNLMTSKEHADITSVICATDAGREGELIFRLVYQQAGCKKPVYRLWISSMEESAIRDGFDHLRPGNDYDSLYQSALCRLYADWLVGINATRLFTVIYRTKVLKVGRVMSPTLAMVVDREGEISRFQPEPYYQVEIDMDGIRAVSDRIDDRDFAIVLRTEAKKGTAYVTHVEKKEKRTSAPKLYDLTTLQRDANRLFGFTAKKTLDCTQSLYEKKLVTYPRTDARFLTDDMEDTAAEIIGLLKEKIQFAKDVCPSEPLIRLVLDSRKVSDHHAIIPTLQMAKEGQDAMNNLSEEERKILSLIINQLLCATAEANVGTVVKVYLTAAGRKFHINGFLETREGWKAFDRSFRQSLKVKEEKEPGDEEETVMNGSILSLEEGTRIRVTDSKILEKKTQAPKRFTEDTLLSAMERAGASEENDDVERKGLGTPATRAEIIEKLVRSGFIDRKKKLLIPTDDGIRLITILPETVKSPKMTAEWENTLMLVAKNKADPDEFLSGIRQMVTELVKKYEGVKENPGTMFGSENSMGRCPNCGGDVLWGKYGPYCTEKCGMSLKKAFGKEFTKEELTGLLAGGKTLVKGLKSANGGTYDAYLTPDGVQEYSYTSKDGKEISGLQYKFIMEYVEKE